MEKLNQPEVEMPERSVLVSLHNPQVTMLTDEVAIFTGYHNAIVNPPLVKEQTVFRFRETLVVQKIGGKWLIVHQHGSNFSTE
jgi:Calcium/calmodulin dependent protein kinase II association domain